jgi:hypothetical protein
VAGKEKDKRQYDSYAARSRAEKSVFHIKGKFTKDGSVMAHLN